MQILILTFFCTALNVFTIFLRVCMYYLCKNKNIFLTIVVLKWKPKSLMEVCREPPVRLSKSSHHLKALNACKVLSALPGSIHHSGCSVYITY